MRFAFVLLVFMVVVGRRCGVTCFAIGCVIAALRVCCLGLVCVNRFYVSCSLWFVLVLVVAAGFCLVLHAYRIS